MRVSNSPRTSPSSASTAPAAKPDATTGKGNFIDKNQPDTKFSQQWGQDIFLDPRKGDKADSSAARKDGRQVTQGNTGPGQVAGNESGKYVSWQQDAAEFKTGTGFSKDGTGAQFEASAAEIQGDASYRILPYEIGARAGAEANLVSLRGDAGFGKDLKDVKGLDKVDGKVYGGVHSEVLVGANADAKAKADVNLKNGDIGLEAGAGALVGAEASATARGEFGPVGGSVTGSAIAGVGAAVDAKVALEDGKLTIGGKAKAALGVGLGVGTSYTIDFNKLKNTVDNFTGGKASEAVKDVGNKVADGAKDITNKVADGAKDVTNKVADGAKDVGNKIAEGAKDVGNDIKKGVKGLFGF
ncbi:hypothetical protein D7V88_25470 [Corallococcus terminator]|uniref:Uncharacterized protein n=2 Tax=Corallococcus terminator TaxID=2316733 RepID=A0A3A8IY94_9BACT|nr:hypothetical protein [Corallococcus terminator]RKG82283.1 hypothetical protein D7V88_25470 [Corallococcus terminator]